MAYSVKKKSHSAGFQPPMPNSLIVWFHGDRKLPEADAAIMPFMYTLATTPRGPPHGATVNVRLTGVLRGTTVAGCTVKAGDSAIGKLSPLPKTTAPGVGLVAPAKKHLNPLNW